MLRFFSPGNVSSPARQPTLADVIAVLTPTQVAALAHRLAARKP